MYTYDFLIFLVFPNYNDILTSGDLYFANISSPIFGDCHICQYNSFDTKRIHVKVMVQYQGAGQSGKLALPVEGFENQHFKLLIGEDYANLSLTTFSPDLIAGTKNQ